MERRRHVLPPGCGGARAGAGSAAIHAAGGMAARGMEAAARLYLLFLCENERKESNGEV